MIDFIINSWYKPFPNGWFMIVYPHFFRFFHPQSAGRCEARTARCVVEPPRRTWRTWACASAPVTSWNLEFNQEKCGKMVIWQWIYLSNSKNLPLHFQGLVIFRVWRKQKPHLRPWPRKDFAFSGFPQFASRKEKLYAHKHGVSFGVPKMIRHRERLKVFRMASQCEHGDLTMNHEKMGIESLII